MLLYEKMTLFFLWKMIIAMKDDCNKQVFVSLLSFYKMSKTRCLFKRISRAKSMCNQLGIRHAHYELRTYTQLFGKWENVCQLSLKVGNRHVC